MPLQQPLQRGLLVSMKFFVSHLIKAVALADYIRRRIQPALVFGAIRPCTSPPRNRGIGPPGSADGRRNRSAGSRRLRWL